MCLCIVGACQSDRAREIYIYKYIHAHRKIKTSTIVTVEHPSPRVLCLSTYAP